MSEIIALLIKFLPAQIAQIKYLQYVPDAIGTVKELVDLVNRAIKIIKAPNVVKTPEQEQILDDAIAALNDDPYWAEEPHIDPPKPPGK